MEQESTATVEVDTEQLAQEIYQRSLEETAARQDTIDSAGSKSRSLIAETFQEDDPNRDAVEAAVQRLHQEDMTEVHGDTEAKVANLPGAAGLYNGDVIIDINYVKEEGVWLHENQHRKDGPPGRDIDAQLAEETGIQKIDDKLKDSGTKRDALEERAMDAAGEIPTAYRDTHWATMKELEERGGAAGVDIEGAVARLIESNDVQGFQEAVREMAVRELAKEDPEALDEIAQEAQEQNVDQDIRDVIAETREEFEKGPEHQPEQAYALAA